MSDLSDKILASTSKGERDRAVLVLEDGTMYNGFSCGAPGECFGEICFNTALEGYLEVITDPSYAGQIITMTYPQIGNYGVSLDDVQRAHPALRGLVVRDMCETPSNFRSTLTLSEFLRSEGVVAIEGIDTRALVRHIRDNGAMKAGISTVDLDEGRLLDRVRGSDALVGENLVETVSSSEVAKPEFHNESRTFAHEAGKEARFKVVAYDCGVKDSILEGLANIGCDIEIVPWDTDAEEVLRRDIDGVFLSNGPGDPDAVEQTYTQIQSLIGKVPIFGICLGHQMLSKAAGASMEKLKFGHRGGNHPVMNLLTGRVEITAQNHGFSQDFESLGRIIPEESGGFDAHSRDLRVWAERKIAPVIDNERFGRIRLTHINLNDGTPEGMQFLDVPAFSVQYHPEASPGPTDSHYLFSAFARLMEGDSDYLDIDIAKDRLQGWRF